VLRREGFGQWLALPALAVGIVTGNAVLFDLHALEDVPPVRDFSVHTPLLLILLGASALMQSSAHGWFALGMGSGDSALLLRRLFPRATISLVIATSIGFLLFKTGTTSAAFGFGVGAGLTILVNATLAWQQAQRFHDIDLRRAAAEHVLNQARAALAERDAMARRLGASQQRLRRVLDTSVDAYISIDQDGCVTEWNESATQLFGWSYAEALGTPVDTLIIPEEWRSAHRDGIYRFLTIGEGPVIDKPTELTAVRRDGTEVEVELRVWPLEERGSTHFHAFIRDISARKQAEAELLRANRELEEFAAVAAHDLRSPLVAISLTAELIVMQESQGHSDSTVEWANRILEATQRGNALINDLLTLSQISRGPKEFEKVDVDETVHRIAEETLATAGRPARIDIEPLDPAHGDPVLLRQLFANLITNAVKYVPEDREPHVRVNSESVEHGQIVYHVCDNGDGIPQPDLPAVFDMFHRGENSIGSTGSGIGLAICRRVVEHHGGQIRVENGSDAGAHFTVTLPA
jgi:PAS domain S-box-containing protein